MEVRNGFKTTKVGLIPNDWEVKLLSEISLKITVGIASAATHAYRNKGVVLLRNQNIKDGNLDDQDLLYIDGGYEEKFKNKRLKEGDLITARTGYPGTTCLIPKEYDGAQSFTTLISRPNHEIVWSEFLNHYINSETGQSFFETNQIGGGQKNVNAGTLKQMPIPLPPTLTEQRAIATALSDVDALIAALDRLIAKKKAIKQGAMQELLTGRRRLEGFDGAWREWKVGDIGNTYSGLTGKTKEDFARGDGRYITFLNVMNNVRIDINILESVDVKVGEHQNTAQYGDLFFNTSSETPGEVGMCAVLLDDLSQVYLNSFCFGFRLHDSIELDPVYLAYYFRSPVGRNALYSLAQGATRYNLSKSNFNNITLNLPELNEQRVIAQILTDMDTEIAALERQRNKYKTVKQGMMQELLTGKTRLI